MELLTLKEAEKVQGITYGRCYYLRRRVECVKINLPDLGEKVFTVVWYCQGGINPTNIPDDQLKCRECPALR